MTRRKFTGFLFVDSPERLHIIAWDPEARLWKVPCGLVPPRRGAVTYRLDKPLCKTCARLTEQLDTEEARR